VDLYYPNPDRVRVYIDERKNFPYSTTMNQSNVQNNVNKFYIMQVLQCIDSKDDCYFFTRWGRVGLPGMTSEIGPISP
jgi:poly [ADP-ribose] polymerase 2/3/4